MMTDLASYSWMLTPLAAVAALILLIRILLPVTALSALVFVRRYFHSLIPVPREQRAEVGDYVAEARVLALSNGFEFVDTYRPFRGPWMDRQIDIWRAADRKTIAIVSEGSSTSSGNETILLTELENGRRLTTTDSVHTGDPRGLRGVLARPGATFRELYRIHLARIAAHGTPASKIGMADPVSVVEDLDRAHVAQMVKAGLARYRNERQSSWSYTLRGGFEVYYLSQPRIVHTVRGSVGAQSGRAAD